MHELDVREPSKPVLLICSPGAYVPPMRRADIKSGALWSSP